MRRAPAGERARSRRRARGRRARTGRGRRRRATRRRRCAARRASASSCWPTAITGTPAVGRGRARPRSRRRPGPSGRRRSRGPSAGVARGVGRDPDGDRLAARASDAVGAGGSPRSGRRRGPRSARGRPVRRRSPERGDDVPEHVGRGHDRGRPAAASTTGMCRKPPTAILWIATARRSSGRRTTGSGVMNSRTADAEVTPLPATFTTASRSVKIPTSRSPSRTSRQSVAASCIRRSASATVIPASTTLGSPDAERVEVARPGSCRGTRCAGCGTSAAERSAPQLAHVSSPSKLSWRQTGQSMGRLPLLDGPGLAGQRAPWRGRPRPTSRSPAGSGASIRSECVGWLTSRRTPTGTGNSGQNMRDRISARYGSSACASWTSRSSSVMPSSPIVTTSGCRPFRRMPLSRSLPKIIGLPCSRYEHPVVADVALGEVAKAPSLKMLQFW